MEMVKRVKNTFQKTKRIVYSRTDFKDLYTRSTNSNRNRYIRFYIKYIFSLKVSRWMAPSSILQLQDDTARTEL